METNAKIFGVRIDNFSVAEMKEKFKNILDGDPERKFVTTLNPEILLKAHWDENYRNILNSADLNICDGFGIKLISLLKRQPIKARFAGADLVDFLLKSADRNNLKVLVVAAKNSLSVPHEIEQAVRGKYPNLSIKSDYFLSGQNSDSDAIMEEAEIVFVNFGAPEQEKFIHGHRMQFPNAKILIGVGGTFDFLTGKIKRAPKFFRALGLEWLWRFVQEPKRFQRIINATIVFPAIALINKD